jgi:hypothetical protein
VKLRYYGDLVKGKQEGTGQMSWEDKTFYSGEFKNDLIHGKGIAIFPNGAVYDGDCENGKANGMGVLFNIRKNGDTKVSTKMTEEMDQEFTIMKMEPFTLEHLKMATFMDLDHSTQLMGKRSSNVVCGKMVN